MVSKEGVNRTERQGRDDNGGYVPSNIPGASPLNNTASTVVDGGKGAADNTAEGVKGAGSYVGGLLGGGKKE